MGLLKKLLLLFSLCLFSSVANAENLTLERVINIVIGQHPKIMSASNDADAARHNKTAQSWFADPKVGVKFEQVPAGSSSLNNADMKTYSASQEIVFPGTLMAQSAALNAEYQAKQANITETQREIIFEIKQTYFSLLAVRELLKTNRGLLNQYAQGQNILETAYKSLADKKDETVSLSLDGAGVFDGALTAKVKKAETQASLNELLSAEKSLEAKLNLMMGRDPLTPVPTLIAPQLKRIKMSAKILEEKLLSQNTGLKALDFMSKKSQKDVTLAKLSYVPTLMPELEYNQRNGQNDAYTLGLSLNVPLWIHRNNAQIQSAQAQHKQVLAVLANEKLNTTTEFYSVYNQLKQHFETIQLYENNILPATRSLVSTALVSQSANQSSALITLQKMVSYHQANTTYWELWKNYQIEYAWIEKLVGEDL